ncbi:MAG TPA: response regulator [Candidatus Binataceae bacterium]|nr:response regulator [Candidatus Binataceae bacterium]
MEKHLDSKPAGQKILIVDDEFGVLEVLEFILSDLGYSVVTALNGRDALARVKEAKPALIILDYMMPIMDGAAVLEELTANAEYRSIPVIVTSALPEETVIKRCTGYSLFLRKPYKTEPLLNAIEGLLTKHEMTSNTDSKPKD